MGEETEVAKEVKKIKLELTVEQINVIYQGLLEMPAKYAFLVMKELEVQIKAQEDVSVQPDEQK